MFLRDLFVGGGSVLSLSLELFRGRLVNFSDKRDQRSLAPNGGHAGACF